jgi:hypothetical protein
MNEEDSAWLHRDHSRRIRLIEERLNDMATRQDLDNAIASLTATVTQDAADITAAFTQLQAAIADPAQTDYSAELASLESAIAPLASLDATAKSVTTPAPVVTAATTDTSTTDPSATNTDATTQTTGS